MKITKTNSSELGLSILTMIKKMKGEAVNLDQLENLNSAKIKHDDWTFLVNKHVLANGRVNYKDFAKDENLLDLYLTKLSNNPPGKSWSENDKIAYWVNAYNAFTIKLILDHYPVKSIKDIASGLPMINSPWDIKFFEIGGIDFDLNTIEHQILRKHFDEPRIHFAINCASFSCPDVRKEAFEGEKLDQQLAEQARLFLNNSDKNNVTKDRNQLSPIFSWFESDFRKYGSIAEFVSLHHEGFSTNNKIEYLDYDWSLNE